ncbi:hypothetical protein PIB30_107345, partial [Stylosanthes scabra]|nr:hypothetical protein [Stylosanthes scabra]
QEHQKESHQHQQQLRRACFGRKDSEIQRRSVCCFEACQVGSKSEGRTAIVHRGLDRIFSELQEYDEEEKENAKEKRKTTILHEDCTLNDINDLQSPQHVRSKGRPRKRLGSNLEKKIANEINKKNRNTIG